MDRRVAAALCAALVLGSIAGCSGSDVTKNASSAPVSSTAADLTGFWKTMRTHEPDQELMAKVAPNTVLLNDTGVPELPIGDYGGLKPRPAALAAAQKWDPVADLSPEKACLLPGLIYAMQGPFPMEIYQSDRFIVLKLEYFDIVRVIHMDGSRLAADFPHSKLGFSVGRWEGSTLVVETSHLSAATITNNGLDHSDDARMIERFRVSADGKTLLATQEFEDPTTLDNRGVRFIAWQKVPGEHVYPYECDPGFAGGENPYLSTGAASKD